MTHGSLFSGLGGFDLAAEWMGWENLFHCEIEPFPAKVLKYYWPNAKHYDDIRKTDFTLWRGRIDVLTGGFPCQPFSAAGKRKGKEDDRHLWPQMLRAIREIQPRWVVGENVRGIINWSDGLVFDEVQADLEAEGYEVLPFLLPAVGVNAIHRRDRVWFVAYREGFGTGGVRNTGQTKGAYSGNELPRVESGVQDKKRSTPNTKGKRVQRQRPTGKQKSGTYDAEGLFVRSSSGNGWGEWPTEPPLCGVYDGLSSKLDGITFPKWRSESVKGYGNAIVPQVALQIFETIEEYECQQ